MLNIWEKFKTWHNNQIDKWMFRLNLDEYSVYWISFFKGIIFVLILQWIF